MTIKKKLFRAYVNVKRYFDLKNDTDKENTVSSIKSSIPLNGANIWYLICSALLASIGLDVNSPAIIIGAMLISPLMSPILGVGLGFGIHDKETIFISIREFGIAVAISLITSAVYFLISPLGAATTEILARTKPTILDVGVAFFGGVAGIVAGSRSKLANAIPGVAIATALMPPMCTAGFGLATGNAAIFFGAIYLFFINAVFISLSVYFIVRLLKFPYKAYADPHTKRRMRKIILVVITIITIPSIIIFYTIINEVRKNARFSNFVSSEISSENNSIIRWNVLPKGDSLTLKVLVAGEQFGPAKTDSLQKLLPGYKLEGVNLVIIEVGLRDDITKEENNTMIEIAELNEKIKNNAAELDTLKNTLSRYQKDSVLFSRAAAEFKNLFPDIDRISYTSSFYQNLNDSSGITTIPVFNVTWKKKIRASVKRDARPEIYGFLKNKFSADSVIVVEN